MTDCSRSPSDEARAGLAEGGIPIGAALFAADGTLLGRGHNRRVQDDDPSMHAETVAFRAAGRQRDYRKTIMVTTLSPCWYCSGLVRQFGIGAVVIGEARTFHGGHDWLAEHGVAITVLDDERCVTMMTEFIAANPELWNEDIGDEHLCDEHWQSERSDCDRRHLALARPWTGAQADAAPRSTRACSARASSWSPGTASTRHCAPRVRAAAREFFALPDDVKQRYSVPVGGHGWLAPGVEANGYAERHRDAAGPQGVLQPRRRDRDRRPEVDRIWFAPNVWPAEVPALQRAGRRVHRRHAPVRRRSARAVR